MKFDSQCTLWVSENGNNELATHTPAARMALIKSLFQKQTKLKSKDAKISVRALNFVAGEGSTIFEVVDSRDVGYLLHHYDTSLRFAKYKTWTKSRV